MFPLTPILKSVIIWRLIYQPSQTSISGTLPWGDPEPPNQQVVLAFSMGWWLVSKSYRWKERITYQSVFVYVTYYSEDVQLVVTEEIALNPSNTSTWIPLFNGVPLVLQVAASVCLGEDFRKQHFALYLQVGEKPNGISSRSLRVANMITLPQVALFWRH